MGTQQCLEQSRGRELRRRSESATAGVLIAQHSSDGVVTQCLINIGALINIGPRINAGPRINIGARAGKSRCHPAQFAGDLLGRLFDLVAARRPGLGHRRE